jgi:hypothetical protein
LEPELEKVSMMEVWQHFFSFILWLNTHHYNWGWNVIFVDEQRGSRSKSGLRWVIHQFLERKMISSFLPIVVPQVSCSFIPQTTISICHVTPCFVSEHRYPFPYKKSLEILSSLSEGCLCNGHK